MKIICVGRNYAAHAAEMAAPKPAEPVIFLKPDTALLRNNAPFYLPDFSQAVHHEIEVVFRVSKPGKYIAPEHTFRHLDAVGLGIDFTARDLQTRLKEQRLPWDIAKGFNGSAPVSAFLPLTEFPDIAALHFELHINGERRQYGTTADWLFPLPEVVAYASQFFTFNTGDLLFTGTPEGVGPVRLGDRLVGILEGKKLLDFVVK